MTTEFIVDTVFADPSRRRREGVAHPTRQLPSDNVRQT